MQRLLHIPSLMTESEKAVKYNQMMNDIIAYKKQLQPQVALQPPVNISNIPNIPNIRQEVHHPTTPQIVRKRPSLLTPPATVDPVNIPLPSSSAASSSEDEKSTTKEKKWFSYSDDEEEERIQFRITHN